MDINDGTSGQDTICGTNETYNFYKWTSPQASAQTYSIYVTYQLPATFKSFASGQTSIMGRTTGSECHRSVQCLSQQSDHWHVAVRPGGAGVHGGGIIMEVGVASGAADPSTCGFSPSDSIVFKIDVTASQDANAYVGNLNFTFSNF